ncbi:MAG TPA: hypothetical protein VM639_24475 [Dongiaceae bacterium]|nr:hypothetical protein [Dongiaceae bacterium]
MTDIPVIFSGPMVRALLDGRKTMTRRLAWKSSRVAIAAAKCEPAIECRHGYDVCPTCDAPKLSPWQKVQPGDRLWVRETVKAVEDEDFDHCIHYEADHDLRVVTSNHDRESEAFGNWWNLLAYRSDDPDLTGGKLVPPIHMPRWASRLTLVVTATKIERLQDISEADAIAEGVVKNEPSGNLLCTYVPGLPEVELRCADGVSAGLVFARLWRHLHGPESWDANPDVVALSFTVHKTNIDQMKEPA